MRKRRSAAVLDRGAIVVPPIRYDGTLPVHGALARIAAAIHSSRVVIVSGATGSGKSTQLPKLCLELGRGRAGLIGHTQPRRIAAQALARRVAEEIGTPLGDIVGFQVRFVDRTGPRTMVKLMTDGVLLRELERDPLLRRYDTLIVDEAHERSLNIDFLLGVLKGLSARRPDLRIIVTSATIETQRFAAYFDDAPVIDVEGRNFPVELRYRPLAEEQADSPTLPEAVAAALAELAQDARGMRGDALVFLPGERQINETRDHLLRVAAADWEVLPLYSRLSSHEQQRVFAPHQRRRAILATNVAETSLTIPGLRFVIDSGLARISRYSPRAKFQRLPIEAVSQASAEQRKGRCGREGPGICVRLYAEEDYAQRPAYTDPEIRRTNLASLVLQMASLGLGAPEEFPFLDAPDTRLLNDGYRLLQELSAVDGERRITRLGRRMALLPVDPRLARVLLESARLGCLPEALVITSFLSLQDPRERPAEAATAADEKHALFADERSDFVTVLKLWRAFREHASSGGSAFLRRWCREHFLSFMRMREWLDLHDQLVDLMRNEPQGPRIEPLPNPVLHQAILSGFLGGIGVLDEKKTYLGARDTRFVIAPGSPLRGRSPRWIVAASLVETTQLYARMVAAIQPSWIEAAAAHLLRRTYSEAHWDEGRGMAMARETVSLYGRVLSSGHLVSFAQVDREAARRIFVEEALVACRSRLRAGFLERNAAARRRVESFEHKLRRRDLLANDEDLALFYLERVDPRVTSVRAFERWWAQQERVAPLRLDLPAELLQRLPVPADLQHSHPDTLQVEGNALPLAYHFDPTQDDDGVTLSVPQPLLAAVPAARLEWLVPGLLTEKVQAVLRGLPKSLRRALVPIPDTARAFVAAVPFGRGSLFAQLAEFITQRGGERVDVATLRALPLPPCLQLRLRVIDLKGRELRAGRDLVPLREWTGPEAATAPVPIDAGWERSGLRHWDFAELPAELLVQRDGFSLRMYPALEDQRDGVRLTLHAQSGSAAAATRGGLVRLAALALPQQHALIRRRLTEDRETSLRLASGGFGRELLDEVADRAVGEAVFGDFSCLPRTQAEFARAIEAGRGGVVEHGERIGALVLETLRVAGELRGELATLKGEAYATARGRIEDWLAGLLARGFVRSTPDPWFGQLPKYLRAQLRRALRLRGDVARDAALAARLRPYEDALGGLGRRAAGRVDAAALERLCWAVEEYRLSVFAQELRTLGPVSAKRLDTQLREFGA